MLGLLVLDDWRWKEPSVNFRSSGSHRKLKIFIHLPAFALRVAHPLLDVLFLVVGALCGHAYKLGLLLADQVTLFLLAGFDTHELHGYGDVLALLAALGLHGVNYGVNCAAYLDVYKGCVVGTVKQCVYTINFARTSLCSANPAPCLFYYLTPPLGPPSSRQNRGQGPQGSWGWVGGGGAACRVGPEGGRGV